MKKYSRREFLKKGASVAAASAFFMLKGGSLLEARSGKNVSVLLGSHMDYIANLSPAFTKLTGINVDENYITTTDLRDKVTTTFITRTSPWDVIFTTPEVAQATGERNWLVDLSKYTKHSDDLNKYTLLENAAQIGYLGDKFLAIPITVGAPFMIWNKKLMAESGLDPEAPTDWHKKKNSWNDFLEYAKAMTGVINGQQCYGYVDNWGGTACVSGFGTLVQMHGGDLFDENNQPVMNSEEGVAALAKMYDLLHTYKVIDPAVTTYSWVFDASPPFLNGTRGIFITWPFMVGVADTDEQSAFRGHVGFAPNFAVETSASTDGSEFFSIPVFADNEEVAWKWLEYVTSYEAQKLQGINTAWVPIYEELLTDPEVVANLPTAPVTKQVYQYPVKNYKTPDFNRWADILSAAIHDTLNHVKKPKGALDDAVKEIIRMRSR